MEQLNNVPIPLLRWYQDNHRILPWRDPVVPYHTWVSEIMLQQTRVDAVIAYYHRFLSALPTIADLATAPEQQLLKLWEGLGYYNRVRNLQKAARIMMTEHGGELPCEEHALKKLPGIGDYTTGAICSIAFGLPVPAVDGNVLRVISRIVGSEENISKTATKKKIETALRALMQSPPVVDNTADFVQGLMELGALVCVPNGAPKCEDCPMRSFCVAFQKDLTDKIPVKDEKKARRVVKKTVLLFTDGDRYALRQRPSTGLLAGLWELPGFDETFSKKKLLAHLEEESIHPISVEALGKAKHIFTHIEWRMTGFLIRLSPAQLDTLGYTLATSKEITADFPLPSAFESFRSFLK